MEVATAKGSGLNSQKGPWAEEFSPKSKRNEGFRKSNAPRNNLGPK